MLLLFDGVSRSQDTHFSPLLIIMYRTLISGFLSFQGLLTTTGLPMTFPSYTQGLIGEWIVSIV